MTSTPPLARPLTGAAHLASWPSQQVLSASQVTALQAVHGYPCVSVLLSTTPAPRMAATDVALLRHLVDHAGERLRAESPGRSNAALLDELDRIAAQAAAGRTTAALALYASAAASEVVLLPVSVRDRVVIDPTFATRDLVRALHRTPRHVVLVLTATEAKLFHGVADTLRPAAGSGFPLRNPEGGGHGAGERGAVRRTGKEEAGTLAFLRAVDRALGASLLLHPSPLVLVGPERLVAAFRRLSRHLDRLAGTVTGSHARAPLSELVTLVRPVLDTYLHSRQAEALRLLDRGIGNHRAVTGLAAAWLAASHERPEMLIVEDTLHCPARLSAGGDLLTDVQDIDGPDVIDDAVDELIEIVLQRGGWVALADDGTLAGHERVALTLRASSR